MARDRDSDEPYYASVVIETAEPEVTRAVSWAEVSTPLEQVLVRASLCRRPPRIPLDRPVRFRTLQSGLSMVGSLSNISVGGAFVLAERAPPPRTMLAFGLYIWHRGQKQTLRSMAEVVWITAPSTCVTEYGFGIRFVDPPEPMVQTIQELVHEYAG